ncbi:MAG: ABC transporter substrate-binding protein [Terrimicrobiaceae bacterium]|nr:ABC transporter substrate-binding protein [Terrimicrobiaceae bacterium]
MRAALLILFLCVVPLRAEPVLRVGLFPNITHAQALVASNMSREGNGWFETRLGEPTKIEWMVYNAGPSAMEGIFTRAVDLTYVGPSPVVNAYARANGRDVRVLSGSMRGGEALVVRGDGIQNPSDLRGKTIATPQLGNTQDVECRAWLLKQGIRVTLVGGDARVIPTANPDILVLFQQGKLDAAWTVEPWVTRLINEAGGRIFHADPKALTTVLAGREGFLNERPDVGRKFLNAHRELTAWILANPAEAKRRVRDELSALARREIPAELVEEAWTRLVFEDAISEEPFANFLAHAREVGFLRAKVNLDRLIWKP